MTVLVSEHPEKRTCDRCGAELPSKYEVTEYELSELEKTGELNPVLYYAAGLAVNSLRLVRGKDADWDDSMTVRTLTCPDCDSRPSDARSSRRTHLQHIVITGLLFAAASTTAGYPLLTIGLFLLAAGEAAQIANHDTTTDAEFDRVAGRPPKDDETATDARQKFIRGEITEEEFEERLEEADDEELEEVELITE